MWTRLWVLLCISTLMDPCLPVHSCDTVKRSRMVTIFLYSNSFQQNMTQRPMNRPHLCPIWFDNRKTKISARLAIKGCTTAQKYNNTDCNQQESLKKDSQRIGKYDEFAWERDEYRGNRLDFACPWSTNCVFYYQMDLVSRNCKGVFFLKNNLCYIISR